MAYLGNIPIVLPVDGSELADGTITNAKLATGITASKLTGALPFANDIIPGTNNSFDIGSPENKVRDMYISEDSLWIGDEHKVSITGGKMKFKKRKKTLVPSLITSAGGHQSGALAYSGKGSLSAMTTHDWLGYGKSMNAAAKMEDIFAESDFDSENASGVTAGVYGSTSAIPIITVDEDGKVTTVTTVAPVTQSDQNYTNADHTKLDTIATSANNYVHPNHSGDVVSSADGAMTIQTDAVDIAMLSASGSASSSTFLRGDNSWTAIDLTALSGSNLTSGTVSASRLDTATTQAANNNSTKIATTAYVQTELTDLIGGAPGTLATLNELAAAINDDAAYSSTLTTAIATKMPLAGGAFTGAVTTNSTFDGVDIATRDGVLTSTTNTANAAMPKAGGTFTGDIALATNALITANGTNSNLTVGTSSAGSTGLLKLQATGDVKFHQYGSSGGWKDTLTIKGAGNVGIGTDSPGRNLVISGNGPSWELLDAGAGGYYHHYDAGKVTIGMDSSGSDGFYFRSYSGGYAERVVIKADGKVGIGNTNPSEMLHVTGNILVSGEVHSASDIALKENIEPITNAINKLKEISGVTFNMIGEKIRSTGIIAQDVEKVLPEAVANGEFKSVAYGSMVGLLIEAIKEQQTQIDDLKKEIQNGK